MPHARGGPGAGGTGVLHRPGGGAAPGERHRPYPGGGLAGPAGAPGGRPGTGGCTGGGPRALIRPVRAPGAFLMPGAPWPTLGGTPSPRKESP
ncbi:hypothetical protein CKO33_12295 [Ectothiorhodospira mobilis]|nr:hypothetical protein [Ectothiorhodospira mobilis]